MSAGTFFPQESRNLLRSQGETSSISFEDAWQYRVLPTFQELARILRICALPFTLIYTLNLITYYLLSLPAVSCVIMGTFYLFTLVYGIMLFGRPDGHYHLQPIIWAGNTSFLIGMCMIKSQLPPPHITSVFIIAGLLLGIASVLNRIVIIKEIQMRLVAECVDISNTG